MRAMQVSINGQRVCTANVRSDRGRLYANVCWTDLELYLLVVNREEGTPPDQDDHGLPVPDLAIGDVITIQCLHIDDPAQVASDPPNLEITRSDTDSIWAPVRSLEVALNDRHLCTATVQSNAGSVDVYVYWDNDNVELSVGSLESYYREVEEEHQDYPVPDVSVGDVITIRVVASEVSFTPQ
jgi:hypothetical protein